MKEKSKKGMVTLILLIIVVLAIAIYFGVTYFLDRNIERLEKELEDAKNSIVYVEEENVNTSIAKFNTQIMDNGLNTPIGDNSIQKDGTNYVAAISSEGIYFYIKPVEYTGDLEKDISKDLSVFYRPESEEKALEYVKYLIKANNDTISDEVIESMISNAEGRSKEGFAVNENNGLLLSFDEDEEYKYYIVTRRYKTEE